MKKVELTRGLSSSDRPSEVGTSGTSSTSQSHIHNDPMDMDEMVAPIMNKNLIFLL